MRSYLVKSHWAGHGYVPQFNEYTHNGLTSNAYAVLVAASFIGLEKVGGIKEYE